MSTSSYNGYGAQVVNLSGNPGNVQKRVISYQDASYICQVNDTASERNGLIENLSDPAMLTEIDDSIVTLSGFDEITAVAMVNLHFNPAINDPESCLVLVACNLPDQASAVNVFSSSITIGDDTAVGDDSVTTARVGNTDIKYDIISPTHPQIVYDLRNSKSSIERIHLLAIDSYTSGTAEETDLAVTVRAW